MKHEFETAVVESGAHAYPVAFFVECDERRQNDVDLIRAKKALVFCNGSGIPYRLRKNLRSPAGKARKPVPAP